MTARPQLSLCIPATSDTGSIKELTENISQFFQKFPIVYEVLFAVNPQQDQSLSLLQSLAQSNPRYQIVTNKTKLSRAQNLHKLFSSAHGDILITTDVHLATPLSEVFKMLEVFYSDRETDIVFGNRFKVKKSLQTQPPQIEPVENFFRGVIKDKTSWPFEDPFCPVVGIRKKCFDNIAQNLKSTGWHWTPELQRVCQLQKLKSQEIPIFVGTSKTEKPPKSEAFNLLKFVLFRI